jgi:Flp pilus assembly pilin Flp
MPRHSAADPSRDRSRRHWRCFRRDERAVTAVEYGLMAALISVAIIAAVNATGQALNTTLYGQIVTALASMSK